MEIVTLKNGMVNIVLDPGESVNVKFSQLGDGDFTINHQDDAAWVHANDPDDDDRDGILWQKLLT